MSILRQIGGRTRPGQHSGTGTGTGAARGISVKCPKCQSTITFTAPQNDAPLRCDHCHYPMICRSDLLLIVEACKNIENQTQGANAVGMLRRLSEMIPEAGTALGKLPTTHANYNLSLLEDERWNALENAYAAGDDNARGTLDLMVKSSPTLYGSGFCSKCGAKKYFARQGKSSCPYCQSTD